MEEFMTLEEVARYLRVNKKTVYRHLADGSIPATKVGHLWRFERDKINSWLSKSESRQTRRRPVILVVDDEEMIVELFREILGDSGYTLLTARGSQEAIPLIEDEDIDLVFLDLKMPGMNGVDLFAKIKAEKPGVTVVIMTGYPDSDLMAQALAQGPFAVMSKPFTGDGILGAVKSFLRTEARVSRKEA
jgi:excisionase family DNA binding protein